MAAPAPAETPVFRRRWKGFVDVATAVWLVLFFVVFFHVDLPVAAWLDVTTIFVLEKILFAMIGVYAVDIYLKYRWSGLPVLPFMRKRWFDILLLLPIFRPLRVMRAFRAGRAARALNVVARGKKMYGIFRKTRRTIRAARAKRARARGGVPTPAGTVATAAALPGDERTA